MNAAPISILACVDSEIDHCLFSMDQLLNGYHYEHKRSCDTLSAAPPDHFDGFTLVSAIYDRIEKNLMRRPGRDPSLDNWKLRQGSNQSAESKNIKNKKNPSDEVTLERAIVEKWPQAWNYQMPVASGLFGSATDKRRAVDLVFTKGVRHFDFVELKFAREGKKVAETPLYAAMEILGYGLVYLASRRDKSKNLNYTGKALPVMDAHSISLCVLAPERFYRNIDLKWLQTAINNGLEKLVDGNPKMDFRFEKFEFDWDSHKSAIDLPDELVRLPVY